MDTRVSILHLSDLHFGQHSRFPGNEDRHRDWGRRLAGVVAEVAEAQKVSSLKRAVVVVTGDISEIALSTEYDLAAAFFAGLSSGLDIPPGRFVFLPGNHDVSWDACIEMEARSRRGKFPEPELTRRMTVAKFEDFQEFVRTFGGTGACPQDQVCDFRDVGLSVAALNSCLDETNKYHIGSCSEPQAQALMDRWRSPDYARTLKVIALHHNPVLTSPGNIADWVARLKEHKADLADDTIERFVCDTFGIPDQSHLEAIVEDCEVQLVLHGHHHDTRTQYIGWNHAGGMAHALSVGSLSLKPEELLRDQANEAQLLLLDPVARTVKAHVLRLNACERQPGRVDPGTFKPHPVREEILHLPADWSTSSTGRAGNGSGTPDSPSPDDRLDGDIRTYCEKSDALYAQLPVAGFATQLKVPIDLEAIHVPLRAMFHVGVRDRHTYADAEEAEKLLHGCEGQGEAPLAQGFAEAGKRHMHGLVILGDPGAGKTTHLQRLLLWCLRNGSESIGLPHDLLPVFLPLRELTDLDGGLEHFIQQQLGKAHFMTPPDFGERLLRRGNLLFLLDGLDEVADVSRRQQVSERIKLAIRAHSTCRFVVTCRYAGYTPDVALDEHFLEMHIRHLSAEQADEIVRRWYRIVEKGISPDSEQAEIVAEEKAGELIELLHGRDFRAARLFELTRNPLLLTNICLVHRWRGKLPKGRARLYQECTDVLLEHWRGTRKLGIGLDAEHSRRVLQPAALWLHREEKRTRATAEELAPEIQPALDAVKWTGGSARDFLERVRNVSGLLTGWDHEHYGFMHLGFQEYLAAREIRSRAFREPDVLRELAGHFGESWWQEVTLLLLALEDPPLFESFMRGVVRLPAFARFPEMVDACLADAVEVSPAPFLELLGEQPGRDRDLWARQLLALRVIEYLAPDEIDRLAPKFRKHPSPGVRGWFRDRAAEAVQSTFIAEPGGYELVLIPGGTFMMGSPEDEEGRSDWEGPCHEVTVSDFYMGRYPVTNEEYARFLEATGATEPKYWGDRSLNQPRQPVIGVSWNEAQAYAKWAGLRLPSEAEWEYACRAGTTARFYTGNGENDLGRAGWYRGNSGGRLHAVGEKEPNGYGLYDMHGNVWEWVEDDWHDDYSGAPTDGRAWVGRKRGSNRVVRGGSWSYPAEFCRSAYRDSAHPDYRFGDLGFRLSRSVS